ncbi:hypothetical protein [Deinococcus kurensis]|uniref:hypothetical protein n=1 Tax=Deinococcus kurensis TaxID=2662757 RepID=UPI0012D33344|nr:hypothetical protein [Deinococcus kurensis]
MTSPLVSDMIARAKGRSLLALLFILTLLVGICLGLKILELQQVAESALNGVIALALAMWAVRL